MKMIIEYAGKTYESSENNEETAEQAVQELFEDFEDVTKLKMGLKDGGWLILGRDAVRSCAITITDT